MPGQTWTMDSAGQVEVQGLKWTLNAYNTPDNHTTHYLDGSGRSHSVPTRSFMLSADPGIPQLEAWPKQLTQRD